MKNQDGLSLLPSSGTKNHRGVGKHTRGGAKGKRKIEGRDLNLVDEQEKKKRGSVETTFAVK